MFMNVKSRIHRTIKDFENYHEINDKNAQSFLENLKLKEDEICYGVYENIPAKKDERIAITNKGIYLYKKNRWDYIKYSDIEEIKMNASKEEIEQLTLELTDNQCIGLPVRGKKGKFKDIFEFSRFLNRVIGDMKKSKLNSQNS